MLLYWSTRSKGIDTLSGCWISQTCLPKSRDKENFVKLSASRFLLLLSWMKLTSNSYAWDLISLMIAPCRRWNAEVGRPITKGYVRYLNNLTERASNKRSHVQACVLHNCRTKLCNKGKRISTIIPWEQYLCPFLPSAEFESCGILDHEEHLAIE